MAVPPFKVKAIYAYTSEHDDDLKFPEAAIITVTEREDDDWYVGEYEGKSGLFPKNFVEKYEPAPPPRPTRQTRPKPVDPPPAAAEAAREPSAPSSPVTSKAPVQDDPSTRGSIERPVQETEPPPSLAPAPVETRAQPPPAPKPEPAEPVRADPPAAKKPPPPVAEKSSSFKDRLAAFNKQGAAPIAPFKPGGSSSNTFIKKPFVAPPPTYYKPEVHREPPPQRVYHREEDPEIAARRKEDEEAAERAGLTSETTSAPAAEGDEDAPKPVSLKERIALLQKQQQEAAAKRADASTKKKPERPPKKRAESHEGPDVGEGVSRASIDESRQTRDSSDVSRELPPPVRKTSRPPQRIEPTDGNEADQSAAGESTAPEDAGSSTEEENAPVRHPKAPAAEPDVGDEEDTEGAVADEEEEDSMDEETRRQVALRERMAKLSGGMGMGAMFGPPGGMGMPGMAGGAKPKPKPRKKEVEEEEEPHATSAPMVPIPGMGMAMPGMAPQRSMSQEHEPVVSRDDEDEGLSKSISSIRSGREVPDVEEVASPTKRAAPPAVPRERTAPTSPTSTERGVPPPIPGGRPSIDSRPAPPPPPQQQMDESEGSEADDEIPESTTTDLPSRAPPPPLPSAARPDQRMSVDSPTLPQSPISPTENKRASRLPPPIPIASPTMPPAAPGQAARAPPPPPPTGAPPTRQGTTDSLHRKALSGLGLSTGASEEGSEYEGDYDTDIAPGQKHKDALKAPHNREESLDGSMAGGDTPVRSPPSAFSPPAGARALPGMPQPSAPPAPSRKSAEQTRGAPPPVPVASPTAGGDDYDPFNYASTPSASIARSPPPLPTTSRQPPLPPVTAPTMSAPPPVPSRQQEEDSEEEEDDGEDDLYSQPQPPPRRSMEQQTRPSMDRPPPPLPPGAAPAQNRAPPPLPPQAPPPTQGHAHFNASMPVPPRDKAPARPSMDEDRNFGPPSRKSTEPLSRPSMSGQRPHVDAGDFIARDLDLGEDSMWWTQANTSPPCLQNRSDIGFEIEESTSSKRGGKTVVSKDVYVLYQDYSQSVITARYDSSNPEDVQLEQRHEPPPSRLRQDQLENWWTRYGASIARSADKIAGQSSIGDGSAHALVIELLKNLPGALSPVGTRAYGALVYANLGNATVQQYDEIRPGDIVTFRNARFSGKHGGLHTKYSLEVPSHVAVVVEWDGTKRKVRVVEQGRERDSKEKKGKKGKVESEGYRVGDLGSGEVRVWRVVGREYVGWNS